MEVGILNVASTIELVQTSLIPSEGFSATNGNKNNSSDPLPASKYEMISEGPISIVVIEPPHSAAERLVNPRVSLLAVVTKNLSEGPSISVLLISILIEADPSILRPKVFISSNSNLIGSTGTC